MFTMPQTGEPWQFDVGDPNALHPEDGTHTVAGSRAMFASTSIGSASGLEVLPDGSFLVRKRNVLILWSTL